MKKYIYLLLFIFIIIPFNTFSLEFINTNSKVVLVYDMDDDHIIYNKDGSKVVSIASLTKIMTTITAIEKIESSNINYNDKIKVTSSMLKGLRSDASVAGIKVGNTVTYLDLLYATILPSGADATLILGYNLGGVNNFVRSMNSLAKEIGVTNTNFVNTHGLDNKNHYGTAEDILKILKHSLNNELFKKIFTTNEYKLSNGLKVERTVNEYNKLLKLDVSRILGSKTGKTTNAGLCLSSLINSNGHNYILITMGADNDKNVNNLRDQLNIIKYLDDNYKEQLLFKKGDLIKNIEVHYSSIKNIDVVVKEDIYKYLPNDYDKSLIKFVYDGEEKLYPDNYSVSDNIGNVSFYYGDELLGREDVLLIENIDFNIKSFINENRVLTIIVCSYILLVFILITIIIIIKKRNKKYMNNIIKNDIIEVIE